MPHGYTAAVIGQIERFAKGFRDQIVATATRNAPEIAAYNANYIGGDISSGANTAKQIAVRPRFALNPYTLGVKGLYALFLRHPSRGGRARHVWLQRRGDRTREALNY